MSSANISSYSGSGSVYETDDDNIKHTNPLGWLVLPLSPLILVATALVLSCIFHSTIDLKKYIKQQINTIYLKYTDPDIIVKGKLSNKYIKQLNKANKTDEIKNQTQECAICISEITKKQKSVTLNCGHTFHKTCLQPWIKTQTSTYNNPTCPLDRAVIIEIPKITYYQVTYRSDSDNSDFD